jgi:tetratricopeptide (TPR) repeat protein
MKLDNLLFGVIGLLLGAIIGFMGANNINRSAMSQSTPTSAMPGTASTDPALPPNHPPIGTSGDGAQAPGGGAMPEIAAAIEKARSSPQDYEAQMTAADLYYQIQRFDEAAKFYQAAAKLKPGETEPMVKAGNAFFDAEKFEDAEKWYLQALAKDPKNIDVRTDLGLTFFLREPRDIDRAIKEYKASLAIDPEHEITLQNLTLAYNEKGDKENYQATFEKLKKVNPNNPVVTKTAASSQ